MRRGDDFAYLTETLYDELRQLADTACRGESSLRSEVHPTLLVHEAFLRLSEQRTELVSREHVLGLAATMMRRILVDHARHLRAGKRGGGWGRVTLHAVGTSDRSVDLVDLGNALEAFEREGALSVICVYSSGGEILYKAWHDGEINGAVFDRARDQIVLTGVNCESRFQQLAERNYPLVIFALRPVLHARTNADLVTGENCPGVLRPVWYHFIGPRGVASEIQSRDLRWERFGSGQSDRLILNALTTGHVPGDAFAVGLDLDPDGHLLGVRVDDGQKDRLSDSPDEYFFESLKDVKSRFPEQ